MKFETIAKDLIAGKINSSSKWPSSLYFGGDIKKALDQIKSYSMQPRNFLFLGDSGSTTYEYAFTAVYVVDTMYLSKSIKGDYSSVMPLPRISISPQREDDAYRLEIIIGETTKTSKKYKPEELGSKIKWGIVFSAHTHPRIYTSSTHYYHTWFSQQDFTFLLRTQAPVVALVTDSTVWLACKTRDSSYPDRQLIQKMTLLEQEQKYDEMKKYLKSNNDSNIVFYEGTIKGKLNKVG